MIRNRQDKGITLVALVITIIVMLILVAVTITMAVNGGLFNYTGKAATQTNVAIGAEQTLANGKVKIDGKWYASIDDYINNNPIIQSITIEDSLLLEIDAAYNVQTNTAITGQLTAILKNIKGTVNWASDNDAVATVDNTGVVTAIDGGTAKITASVIFEGETYKDECTITVEKQIVPISKTQSYVGCYADIDGVEGIDGIIYADLALGNTKGTKWTDNDGIYTIPVETDLKDYYVSQTDYVGTFGKEPRDVIKLIGGDGKERFYVMTLSNLSSFCWYYNAYGKLKTSDTAVGFGTGKANTVKIKEYWDKDEESPYGTQRDGDLWSIIDTESRWFVPSRGEWAAFAQELGITKSTYKSYGLSDRYWSSSLRDANSAWQPSFGQNWMDRFGVREFSNVRLSTKF